MKVPSEALSCPICYLEYNSTQNLPMIIPGCGHTICSKCLTQILENPNSTKCPLDNQRFSIHQVGIESFPVNFIVKQLFDKTPSKTLCETHNEKLRLMCLTDKCAVCDACAFSGDHKGHQIKPVKKFEQEVSQKRKELEEIINQFAGCNEDLNILLEEKRGVLLEYIKSKFQEMKWVLVKKELELLSEVNSYFDHQRTDMTAATKQDAQVIFTKVEEIKRLLNQNEPFKIYENSPLNILPAFLDEQKDQLNTKIDSQAISLDCQMIQQIESLDSIHFWKGKHSPSLKDLNSDMLKIHERDDWLVISLLGSGDETSESPMKKDWGNFSNHKKVILRVERDSMKKCLQSLISLWPNFGDLTHIKLELLDKDISDKELLGLFSIVFEHNHVTLQELRIDLSDCRVGDQSLGPFACEIFPAMTALQSLTLNFNFTNISDNTLVAFANEMNQIARNLQELDLRLWGTKITDLGVAKLFTPMENLKRFTLDLGSTSITDKSLIDLAYSTLPGLKQIEELKLNLSRTEITDQVLQHLNLNLPTIQVFMLNLHGTCITNQTVEALAKNVLPNSRRIKSFDLRLGDTKVTDDGIIQLSKNLGNVENFMLKLQNTLITDKSVENMFKLLLPTMTHLKELDIDVLGTKVSRKCSNQLLKIKEKLSQTNLTTSPVLLG